MKTRTLAQCLEIGVVLIVWLAGRSIESANIKKTRPVLQYSFVICCVGMTSFSPFSHFISSIFQYSQIFNTVEAITLILHLHLLHIRFGGIPGLCCLFITSMKKAMALNAE